MKKKNDSSEQASPNKNQPKRVYQEPQLQVFGDLRGITQNIGMKGANDGGKGFSKTHVL